MSNIINAKEVKEQAKVETSLVNYKLRITLIFRTSRPTQKERRNAFRQGKKVKQEFIDNDIAAEISGSTIRITDQDEKSGEYLVTDDVFVVDENSPKALCNMSKKINQRVIKRCRLSNVKKVKLSFIIPLYSNSSVIPKLFFIKYPPSCISSVKEVKKDCSTLKIEEARSLIYLVNIDDYTEYDKSNNIKPAEIKDVEIDKETLPLLALMSYYVYYYIDFEEQKDWSYFKKDFLGVEIGEWLDEKIDEVEKAEKAAIKNGLSVWEKIVEGTKSVVTFPFKLFKSVIDFKWFVCTLDFLFNYDGHLKNRIFTRIFDVLLIVKPNLLDILLEERQASNEKTENEHRGEQSKKEEIVKIILDILSSNNVSAQKSGHGKQYEKPSPIGIYDFYDKCGYWEYLCNRTLEGNCHKWVVVQSDKGWFSGYGALLFMNEEEKKYVYCFKGTDFDSYAKDWLSTNLIQGLSGFSLQHIIAVQKAKEWDQLIGRNGHLWFTGHSLGGGLASAATIATEGRTGYTFNAAGLNFIGVKMNQLFNHGSHILHPSRSWKKVFPYRIKGEILDVIQNYVGKSVTLGIWERGYGINSVEFDISNKDNASKLSLLEKCKRSGSRHGIINFLYKEVIESIEPFSSVKGDTNCDLKISANNKILKIWFYGQKGSFESNIEGKLC